MGSPMKIRSARTPSLATSICTTLFRLTLLLIVCSKTNAVLQLPPNVTIPAVLAFGDSIIDTGNNNNLNTLVKSNFPPYGKDFPGGIPTGRFCNGKVPSDLLAEELGIKEILPAYLDPNLKPSELPTGVCFASSGTGYDSLTAQLASVISLSAQLDMFKEYIGKLKGLVGEDKTNFILANSVFLVVSSSNDISNTYFLLHARRELSFPAFADLMVNSASAFLKELYQLGARRIAVFSAPPIGCLPLQRTLAGGLDRQCVQQYNDAAVLYNNKLSTEIDSLRTNLRNSTIDYIDVYTPLLDIIVNNAKYGFNVVDKGCCGTGTVEVSYLCNKFLPTCPNDQEYVFWDSFHPTEAVYKTLVPPIVKKFISQLS